MKIGDASDFKGILELLSSLSL